MQKSFKEEAYNTDVTMKMSVEEKNSLNSQAISVVHGRL